MAKKNPIFKHLDLYLEAIGADLLETKSEWELARFKANDEICVIYKNSRGGRSFSNALAQRTWEAFYAQKIINIQSEKRITLKQKFYQRLIERDGNKCFYTGKEMTLEESSIEHLIPLSKGGKNNLDNLVLCFKEENLKMANLPLVEKIKYKIDNIKQ